jgi:hypothetical protein
MQAILGLVRALFIGWLTALIQLLRSLVSLCRSRRGLSDDQKREQRRSKTRCVPIHDPAYVRPDPMIYDQYYLMANGFSVTWDNPDFAIFRGGVLVNAHDLQPDTDYDVVVRVWNRSTDCPVVMMPVHLSYLSFGVQTLSHPIATRPVDIGAKGTATNPGFVQFGWRTPPTKGHYCLQALLDPVADIEFGNNLGQHNTDVVSAHSPATFTFDLRNNTSDRKTYSFRVDAYALGPIGPCTDDQEALKRRQAANRGDLPLPDGWVIDVSPANPAVNALQVIPIQVTVTPPLGFVGQQTVNVHTFMDDNGAGRPVGGVTVTVTAS